MLVELLHHTADIYQMQMIGQLNLHILLSLLLSGNLVEFTMLLSQVVTKPLKICEGNLVQGQQAS